MIKLIQKISQGTEVYMISQERNCGIDWLRLKKKLLNELQGNPTVPFGVIFSIRQKSFEIYQSSLSSHLTSQSLISNPW